MSDLISRQAAIDELRTCQTYLFDTHDKDLKISLEDAEYCIERLPSAQPERKKGKWIKEYWNGEHTRKCSACNITQTVTTYRGKVNFNFCPYCGADMRGEQDEAD